jgi:hypothetical protein
MVLAEVRKSLYFSLLAGNFGGRKVRTGLLPPPASLELAHSSSDSNGRSGFAAQLPRSPRLSESLDGALGIEIGQQKIFLPNELQVRDRPHVLAVRR